MVLSDLVFDVIIIIIVINANRSSLMKPMLNISPVALHGRLHGRWSFAWSHFARKNIKSQIGRIIQGHQL